MITKINGKENGIIFTFLYVIPRACYPYSIAVLEIRSRNRSLFFVTGQVKCRKKDYTFSML